MPQSLPQSRRPIPPPPLSPRVHALEALLIAEQFIPMHGTERVQLIREGDAPCPRFAVLLRAPEAPGCERIVGVHLVPHRPAALKVLASHPWPCEMVVDLDNGQRYRHAGDELLAD